MLLCFLYFVSLSVCFVVFHTYDCFGYVFFCFFLLLNWWLVTAFCFWFFFLFLLAFCIAFVCFQVFVCLFVCLFVLFPSNSNCCKCYVSEGMERLLFVFHFFLVCFCIINEFETFVHWYISFNWTFRIKCYP